MADLDKKCEKIMMNRLRDDGYNKIGIRQFPINDLPNIRELHPYGQVDVLCKTTRERAALRRRYLVRKAKSSRYRKKVLNHIKYRKRAKSSRRRNVVLVLISFDIPNSNFSRY
jgi:hypothetical protein